VGFRDFGNFSMFADSFGVIVLFLFSTMPEDYVGAVSCKLSVQVQKYECEEYQLLYQVLIRWPITSVL